MRNLQARPRKVKPIDLDAESDGEAPVQTPMEDGSSNDKVGKPKRVDWLSDAFKRREIFRVLMELDYAWKPVVVELQKQFPKDFATLSESTVRKWYEPREGKKPPKLKAKVQEQLKRGKAHFKPTTSGKQQRLAGFPDLIVRICSALAGMRTVGSPLMRPVIR